MELVLNNIEVKKDEQGRYSLNDLHKASGGQHKDQPARFIRLKSFTETVDFLTTQMWVVKPFETKAGRHGGGTWVCEQLVVEYAMWVSVEFKVKVMQFFLDGHKDKEAPATMEALNELTKKIESDKEIASKCGSALAHYKRVKRENKESWIKSANEVQFNLGFK